jgi:molybdenum cofactor guanylyltransferase
MIHRQGLNPEFAKPQARRVISLILAGGQSRRMGQDKALLLWERQPLLQRVYEVAASLSSDVYLLSPWPERYRACIPNATCLTEAEVGAGPLVAFNQALQDASLNTTNPAWLLLLACDMPCLDPHVLRRWQQSLSQLPAEVLALVPRHADGRWEPLCGWYRPQIQPQLQQFMEQGGRSFQSWLQQLSVQALPISADLTEMFWNCNYPQDLKIS